MFYPRNNIPLYTIILTSRIREVTKAGNQAPGDQSDDRVPGLLLRCNGEGPPWVPVEWLKDEWRKRGLLKRFQLTISGCIGPCDLTNVVEATSKSGSIWLGNITEFSQYRSFGRLGVPFGRSWKSARSSA
jgi:hypothetical protein